ncbi:MAG: ROK family protein [Rubripirellula sp.]
MPPPDLAIPDTEHCLCNRMSERHPNCDQSEETALFLGIDVGGTNVKLGLVDANGTIQAKDSTATPPLGTPQRVFEYAMQFATANLARLGRDKNLTAVGLAVPGVLDSREHVLREVVNLPGWLDQPLKKILFDTTQLPAAVINDANAAAYAEHTMRALGSQSLALVTLGTGIGCGVVGQGVPFGGDHGCAGELGHIAIRFGDDALPCTCGSRGHLESYAGAAGVIARLRKRIDQHDSASVPSSLLEENVTPRDIAEAAADGCEVCQTVIDDTGQFVGQAIGLLGQVLDPAVVLLGGAMTFGGNETETGRRFLETVRDAVKQTTLVQVGGNIIIEFASLGNDAGVLGGAMVAKQVYQN